MGPTLAVMQAQRRVRLSPDARREQLLELGVQMLATRTLEELSVDVFAEEAGISRGLLFHYFKSKQDFHHAVVQRAADELIEATEPDSSLSADARLAHSLEAYVDYVVANHRSYVSLVRGAAGGDEALLSISHQTRNVLASRIIDNLDVFDYPDTPAVRLLARAWSALVEEAVLTWVADPQLTKQELVQLLAGSLPAMLESH